MARISEGDKALVRARLLQSAARHFAAHGLHGANINAISTDAGYSKGTVYNYFPSKEALFSAVLGAGSALAVERYQKRAPAGDFRARLIALVEEDVALVRAHEDFMRVLLREAAAASPATRALIDEALAPLDAVLVALLSEARTAGALRADLSVHELARAFAALLFALYGERLRDPSGTGWPPWDALPALAVTLFLDGAAARPQAGAPGPRARRPR